MRKLALVLLAAAVPACGGSGDGPSRSFAMGFTPFPYARSVQAVDDTWAAIGRDADLVVFHYDDGVPWQEAYDQAPYPAGYQNELAAAATRAPAGHVRYLALTPIAFSRDRLADYRSETGSTPPTAPWDGYAFDDPHVLTAFTRHCERMIAIFQPDVLAFGVEVNLLAYFAPAKWSSYASHVQSVYQSLKAAHPGLPMFVTLQADLYAVLPAAQKAAILPLLPYTDYIALSAYPYSQTPDPAMVPPNLFSAVAALAPEKPFAIAETGWAAEDVTAPYPQYLPETPERQKAYVEFLLAECTRLRAVFINWFLVRDYDGLWPELGLLPTAPLTRVWRDIGLYDGNGQPRPALSSWRSTLGLPRR